jgi:MFS transporter, DHA1 family, multidrug resistance protein
MGLTVSKIVKSLVIVPWKINALDSSVLFTSIYCGLIYAIFYSFFEAFPLMYMDVYGMSIGQMGLIFISIIVAVCVAGVPYFVYIHTMVNSPIRKGKPPPSPEARLMPALVASFLVPTGLLLFAWTSRARIHWILPTIGAAMASGGTCIVIQCIFVYLAKAYPQYAASLFGGNNFVRAGLVFAAILWSGPLYSTLGIARGTSLLAGLCAGCIVGMFILINYGATLRRMSKFAVSS